MDARFVLRHVLVLLAPIALAALAPAWEFGRPVYLPIHSVMEGFAVVVAALVFAIGSPWVRRDALSWSLTILSSGFLAVALLDFGHLLSYGGMPDFFTPSSTEKAIYFWLAARLVGASTLLAVALLDTPRPATLGSARAFTFATVVFCLALFAIVIPGEDHLPAVFIDGLGLQPAKLAAEVVVVFIGIVTIVVLLRRGAPPSLLSPEPFTRAVLVLTIGELPLLMYASATDVLNLLGHVYKVYACWLLYRAVFVAAVEEPYVRLEASMRALAQSQAQMRELASTIEDVFWLREVGTGRLLYVSPAFERVWGRPLDRAVALDVLIPWVHPEDREHFRAATSREAPFEVEHRIVRPDGGVRWLRTRAFSVPSQAGEPARVAGVTSDITEVKQASERLLRAQKMEGIGQLAGGVAHDFNNLLTVILSATELASLSLSENHPARDDLQEVRAAAERAAALTRQLLAFARREPARPRIIDLGEVVQGLGKMLRRVIGEDIQLSIDAEPGRFRVLADPGQLEQVLLNLAINARDAMPGGGRLEINVAAAAPGRVAVRVRDTGHGMTPEVLARAFEPFFTTKGPGRGTGLGLSTCFGIVQQSHGTIDLESEPDRGTTVTISLPIVEREADGPTAKPASVPRGRETVLVVEDERAVRELAVRVLIGLGYRVVEAFDGLDALERAREGRIDLLFTDLVMPRMGGRELARKLVEQTPDLRVLLTSGHEPNRDGASRSDDERFLPKPYGPDALARKIREVLDAGAPRSER